MEPERSKRGLAHVAPERRREIAREGGRAAHAKGRAHTFTPEEASRVGKEGGLASGRARKARKEALARQVNDADVAE